MGEEIRLDVVSVAHSRGLKDAAGDLGRLSSESDKAAKGLHRASDETFNLDHAIAEARTEVARLNDEFKRTGDTTLFRNMRRQRAELNQLLKVAEEGSRRTPALDFGGEGLRPRNALIAGVVGAAVVLSPMIGAMIAGAVTGAVGAGGIAGGIAMASKDARVRAAASKFGQDISGEFFRGGAAFVDPTIKSLGILSEAFRDMDLGTAFAKLAPHVEVLAKGLGAMFRNIMPGLNAAFDRMGPFIDAAADGLAEFGTTLGDTFNRLSRSEGAVLGLKSLFHLLNGTLIAVGSTLEFLSETYKRFIDVAAFSTGVLEDAIPEKYQVGLRAINNMLEQFTENNQQQIIATRDLGREAGQAGDNWNAYAGQVEIVRQHQEDLNREIQNTLDLNAQQDNAVLRLQQAMFDLGEEFKENGNQWSIHTQKGLDNRRALQQARDAAMAVRDADIKRGNGSEEATRKANEAYNKTLRKLEDMARKAGITEDALKDLVGDYYVNVHYRQTGSAFQHASKILEAKGRASGGPVWGPGTFIVGEGGRPEVLELGPGANGHVYPSFGAYRGARGGGAMGGGGARPVNIIINGTHEDRELIARIAREVGKQGGTLAVLGIRG